MVNMPPAMRCTSPGRLRIAGRPNVTTKVIAAPMPVTTAITISQMPSHITRPISPSIVTGPNTVNGQLLRCIRSGTMSIRNEPISCEPFIQASVVPIKSPRPVIVR